MEYKISASEAFKKHSDMVYRLAVARVKNKYDADDILQEVFLRFIKVKDKVENDEHLKALLIRITINCSKSLLMSSWFKRTESLSESFGVSDEYSDTLDAVLRLPKKYRTVIHLHYYMGYSVNEISSILKSKPSTVKSQLHRARKQLKIELEGEEVNV
ncbi:MAG: RNA polymerase sigma factor [Clostridia bacterium]|nr:RNA polymerase sigma factor [Clostridia bacterium]MBR4116831.1 RNA polymerase sigma factor [Clostridia bacterium]